MNALASPLTAAAIRSAKKMAALCDVYVNDAFGTAHRAEGTTYGIAQFARIACAGPLLAAEIDALKAKITPPPFTPPAGLPPGVFNLTMGRGSVVGECSSAALWPLAFATTTSTFGSATIARRMLASTRWFCP